MRLGAHESVAGGFANACTLAEEDGAEAVQIFVKSANRWFASKLEAGEIEAFVATFERIPASSYCAHGAYLLNLAAADAEKRSKAMASLAHELERCNELQIPWLVLHPGSHVGQGVQVGCARVAAGLDEVHKSVPGPSRILLEVMAGQGSNLGSALAEIRAILDVCNTSERLNLCLDTCHLFAAGYAIHEGNGYRTFKEELDRLGLTSLVRVVHLNDSEHELGSRKDRHANIGAGHIGLEGFRPILNDKDFADCLGILETPHAEDGRLYKRELAALRGLTA